MQLLTLLYRLRHYLAKIQQQEKNTIIATKILTMHVVKLWLLKLCFYIFLGGGRKAQIGGAAPRPPVATCLERYWHELDGRREHMCTKEWQNNTIITFQRTVSFLLAIVVVSKSATIHADILMTLEDTIALTFTARCCAERGYATVCRPSVGLSVMFRYCDHIGWNTLQIILRLHSLRYLPMTDLERPWVAISCQTR